MAHIAVYNIAGGGQSLRRQAVAGGKVVGTAGRNIAEIRTNAASGKTGDDLVERTVAADADQKLKAVTVQAGKFRSVALA